MPKEIIMYKISLIFQGLNQFYSFKQIFSRIVTNQFVYQTKMVMKMQLIMELIVMLQDGELHHLVVQAHTNLGMFQFYRKGI
jgi:hypothetical protein